MKLYELTYLISPELSEEEVKILQEKIKSLVQKEEGLLDYNPRTGAPASQEALASRPATREEEPIKKKLAYPIKKNSTAILKTLNFQLAQEKLENLEKKLKEESGILRYLILTKRLAKEVVTPTIKLPKVKKPRAKVELKEIEKKLEEILGE